MEIKRCNSTHTHKYITRPRLINSLDPERCGSNSTSVRMNVSNTFCGTGLMWVPQNPTDGKSSHWGRDKMTAVSRTTLSNEFSWMEMLEFRLRLHKVTTMNITMKACVIMCSSNNYFFKVHALWLTANACYEIWWIMYEKDVFRKYHRSRLLAKFLGMSIGQKELKVCYFCCVFITMTS